MSSLIRSRRISLAAGALAVALVAPLSPALSPTVVPMAVAQDTNIPAKDDFVGEFRTTWDEDRGIAIVQGITLAPGVEIKANYKDGLGGTKLENRWQVSVQEGQVLLKPPSNVGSDGQKAGNYSMPIRVLIPQGLGQPDNPKITDTMSDGSKAAEAFNVTADEFKFHVDRTPAWVRQITGLDERHIVDFSENPTQTLDAVNIPANAETYTETSGWTTRNDNGKLQLTPPSTYGGGITDVKVKIRVPDRDNPERSWSETVTVKIDGTKPQNNVLDQLLGLFGGEGGGGAGGALGAILGLLGLAGGGAGGGGLLPGLNSLISVNIPDAKIDIHGNSINDSGNPVVEVKDNNANATVEVKDNNAFVDVPVNVTDNFKDNVKDNDAFERGLLGGGGTGGGNGLSSSKKGDATVTPSNSTSGNGNAATPGGANSSSDRLKRPECIASIVGFGLPMVVLVPVILSNVLRIPGFEGMQDAMKAAAASLPTGLNVSDQQIAAGVGGFAGALSIAALAGIITQCVPSADEAPTATITEK